MGGEGLSQLICRSTDPPGVLFLAEPYLVVPGLLQVHGLEPMEHPFLGMLFLGQDGRGDYIPCRHLRNRYNAQRRDVFKPGEEPRKA